MKISVVIPTYNRSDLLNKTLTSLVSQTLDKSLYEVVVVDDGGVDDSRAVCEQFQAQINVRYLWQQDLGFRAGKARNLGITYAEGKYIVLLDCGIVLSPSGLALHLERHEADEYAKVIIGYVYGFGATGSDAELLKQCINADDVEKAILLAKEKGLYDIRQSQYDDLGDNISAWPAPFDIFWTAHVSAERQALIRAGLFDEGFNSWGGEDVELGIRLFKHNNKFELDKDICSIHWPHQVDDAELDDKVRQAGVARLKIKAMHNLWQTSFYDRELGDAIYSLNRVIRAFA
ncbi:glycosyltransferase [Bowmanella denitrificans]|uniref:glycosyltransferase n=1 Tax=Bowmanella denitrificans TaxID=366582 RepID=UPI000C9AC5CE|nr:glycosyltransferase [Bowmanella denitrificans]